MKRKFLILVFPVLLLLFSSCVSSVNLDEAFYLYGRNDFEGTKVFLEKNQKVLISRQGELIKDLDFGLVNHASGDFNESNKYLEEAEEEFDRLYTQSVTRNIASFIVNDNTQEYQGQDWESIYSNVFKSLNYYFLDSLEDAMVEVRKSIEKQTNLVSSYPKMEQALNESYSSNNVSPPQNIKQNFCISALSQYLSMLFSYEYKDENTFRYSSQKLEEAYNLQSDLYPFTPPQSIEILRNADNKTILANFLIFTGNAPIKIEENEIYRYSDSDGNDRLIHYSFPTADVRLSLIKKIEINLEGINNYHFFLEPIERLDLIALDTMKTEIAYDKLKAISRVIGKNLLSNGLRVSASNSGNSSSSDSLELIADLFDIFNFVSERADVRGSHFFPSTAWIGLEAVEKGYYKATIKYYDINNKVITTQIKDNYNPVAGKANLLEAFLPK
ncbi:MAG: hypothetical protein PHD05_02065 [Sphaerochaetaceae bacterium]|nr:hypothetical protein [Sphaerochaetaceae bacterium]